MGETSKTSVSEQDETPVRETCDVLVVGGGTAGVIAARQGVFVKDIDPAALRENLQKDGAYLG